ncbi:MAG: DMT family transporter [Alphaproteobacteria bacterium]|nr:DMT family transporter [Alphaproteobacteria bacterium]
MTYFLYFTTVFVWGSTWYAIACQLGTVPIDISIFYRFALAAIFLFAWCFAKKSNMKFSWKDHVLFVFQGFFQFSMNYLAAYEATCHISSGLNAVGFSMILVFNIMNSALFFGTRLTTTVFLGALSGLLGIVVIFWPSIMSFDLSNSGILGIIYSLLGAVFASFGNMISAYNQKRVISVMESNAYGMGYGALWLLLMIFLTGDVFQFDLSFGYISSLVYLSVLGTIVAFWCYLTLLGRIGASRAAYVHVLTPVVALVLSTFLEDFVWETHIFIGVGLILLGNVIILARKSSKKSPVSLPKGRLVKVA